MDGIILWEHNPARSFIDDMTPDEIDLFEADLQDAIDKGAKQAPAYAIIEQHHLDFFIQQDEYEDE